MVVEFRVMQDEGKVIGSDTTYKSDGYSPKTLAEIRVRMPEDPRYDPPVLTVDIKEGGDNRYDFLLNAKVLEAIGVKHTRETLAKTHEFEVVDKKSTTLGDTNVVAGNMAVTLAMQGVIAPEDAAITLGKLTVSVDADVFKSFHTIDVDQGHKHFHATRRREVFNTLHNAGYGNDLFRENVQLIVHDDGGPYEDFVGVKFGGLAASVPLSVKKTALEGRTLVTADKHDADYSQIAYQLTEHGIAFRPLSGVTLRDERDATKSGGLYIDGTVTEVLQQLADIKFITPDIAKVAIEAVHDEMGAKATSVTADRGKKGDGVPTVG